MTIPVEDLPVIGLYGLNELQTMALHQTLRDKGVDDPATYLRENTVVFVAAFKQTVGVSVTITRITPKPPESSLPSGVPSK